MGKYYVGSGGGSWKGGTWGSQSYGGALATDLTALDAASATLWAEMAGQLTANNQALGFGLGAVPAAEWSSVAGDGATGSHWQAAWEQWLPNNAVGANHAPRPPASGATRYDTAPPGGAANITFSKTAYNAATAAMSLIVTRSIDYNALAGTYPQRTLMFAQLNEDHSRFHWDNAPTYLTSVTWNSATSISWAADNESDTFYRVILYVKSAEHGWGFWNYYATSARGADTTNPTHTNTEALVCIARANDDFVFQTHHIGMA